MSTYPDAPKPHCALYATALPALRTGALTAAQRQVLRAHLRGCATCREQAQADSTRVIEEAVRRHYGIPADTTPFHSLDDIRHQVDLAVQSQGHRIDDKHGKRADERLADPLERSVGTRSQPSRRSRLAAASWWRTGTAVAAAVVLVAVFALVFHSFAATGGQIGTWVKHYEVTAGNGTLVVAPSDPSVIYQLTPSGSLAFQRSDDSGKTWTTSTVPGEKVKTDPTARLELEVSPLNAMTVFATIESNPSTNPNCPRASSTCSFQYVSTDGGSSWTVPDVPVKGDIGGQFWFAGSPLTPPFVAQGRRLYTALVPNINAPAPQGFRLVSSTDGIHWTAADAPLVAGAQSVTQYVATPDGSTLFATTLQVVAPGWSQSLLWESGDAGASWNLLDQYYGDADGQSVDALLGAATINGTPVLYTGNVFTSSSFPKAGVVFLDIIAYADKQQHDYGGFESPGDAGTVSPYFSGTLDNGALVVLTDSRLGKHLATTSSPAGLTFYSWRPGHLTWPPDGGPSLADQGWMQRSPPLTVAPGTPRGSAYQWLTPAEGGSPATMWVLTDLHGQYTLWSCPVR